MMKRVSGIFLLILCCCCFLQNHASAAAQRSEPVLSTDERQYLQEKKALRVSVVTDWKPFSYQNDKGGFEGLPVEMLNHFSETADTPISFILAQSYEESLSQLATGEADVCAMLTRYNSKPQPVQKGEPLQLVPYLTCQTVLISHKDTVLGSLPNVAMADVAGRADFIQEETISLRFYPTQESCLVAVRSGQADVAVCDIFTSSILMQRYKTRDLLSAPTTIMLELGFGVLPNADKRLISLLEKVVICFPESEMNVVLTKGNPSIRSDFFGFIYLYPLEIICFSFALMFVLLLTMHVYTKLRLRQQQSLQGYEESYRLLSDTFGEAAMEYDYLNDRMTLFGEKSNLDIDPVVDDFHEKLRTNAIRIALTAEQFDAILAAGAEGNSFSAEVQCGVKAGDWVWYRLIYTVICTTESHRRPIRLVGCLANIDADHLEKERLLQLSSNDQLTGLYNRAVAEKLIRERLMAQEEQRTAMLLVLDIDFFKSFNDKMGHSCGDDVLRTLGRLAQESFLPTDILCRWGGDEFLFFLEESPELFDRLVTRFDLLCKKMRNYTYHGNNFPVTLSAGGVTSYPDCTFEALFEQADKALYLAKKNGRAQLWRLAPADQEGTSQGEGEA